MEINNLIETFAEFKEQKSIDRATMMRVIEEVFRNILAKMYGTDENFDIIINIDKGDLEIWRNRVVVEDADLQDPNLEISLSDAKKIDSDYEIDEEVTDEVPFRDFGRRNILTLRQNLTSKILELEKEKLYEKYKNRIGEIVAGEVYQVWKREILILDDEGNELMLPKAEQIPTDFFRKGDNLRAVISHVEMRNHSSSYQEQIRHFSRDCLNWKFPKLTTDLSQSRKLLESRANAQKWLWKVTTTVSTQWAHAWA